MPYLELDSKEKIFYRISGNKSGEPFLLIHGWCGDYSTFLPLIKKFSKDFLNKYKIILITLSGHGDSSKPDENTPYEEILKKFTMENYAKEVKEFLDKLGVKGPIIIAGHSMGGTILFNFVLKYPNLVKAIIPMGTWIRTDDLGKKQIKMLINGAKNGIFPTNREGRTEMFMENAFSRETRKNTELSKYIMDIIMKVPTNLMLGLMDNFTFDYDVVDKIKGIEKPTLIFHGEKDKMQSYHKGEEINSSIKGSKLILIPKGSHCFYFEQPELVAPEIEKFLNEI